MAAWKQARFVLRRRVVDLMTDLLTKPLQTYEQRIPNDLTALKAQLRPGDIVLIEGDQRVSQVIRYLTQSSWSHAALYIADDLRRVQPALADKLLSQHGADARHLLVEATAEDGVTCSPVLKYARYNIRICRPRGLRRDDFDCILREVTEQLGLPYNVRHVFELGRYFFPVSLIPRRFRRAALRLGGSTTRVICTTMIARAFGGVGFPIVPRVTLDAEAVQHNWVGRMLGRNGQRTRAVYQQEDPAFITPRDFDLSPYFDIVKFNVAHGKFDYRRIEWAERTGAPAAVSPAPAATEDPAAAQEVATTAA
jgi:hypothetical protein